MLNDITDAQKLKAIAHRSFEGADGEILWKYIEILGCLWGNVDDAKDRGRREMTLDLRNLLILKPEQILQLYKGR
jgi:hypothetical protein